MKIAGPTSRQKHEAIVILHPNSRRGYQLICSDDACRRSADPVAKKIYGTIVNVQQFFSDYFQMQGLDGQGSMKPFVIRWDQQNAQWTCRNGECMFRFNNIHALRPEIVAHKYMHGVINYLNPIQYSYQSGALNESLADVIGIAFKHWLTGTLDWRIGHLRDLSQYVTMHNYLHTRADFGGVHTNSGIPNHAFYQATRSTNSIQLVARIWFQAFQEVDSTASFKDFAKKTVEIADRSNLPREVSEKILFAWKHVDVLEVKVQEQFKQIWDMASMTFVYIKEIGYLYK